MSIEAKGVGFIGTGSPQLPLKDFHIEYAPLTPDTCTHPTICEERSVQYFEDVYYCPHCRLKIGIPLTNHLAGSNAQIRENILGILGLTFGEDVAQRLREIGR